MNTTEQVVVSSEMRLGFYANLAAFLAKGYKIVVGTIVCGSDGWICVVEK